MTQNEKILELKEKYRQNELKIASLDVKQKGIKVDVA